MIELNCPLISVDVETTGTHPKVDRIVQIALIKVYPDGKRTPWDSLINPCCPIPPEVTKIHGITDAMAAKAPTFAQLAPTLWKGFHNCDFLAYNGGFDLRFLDEEFKRLGHSLPQGRLIDPFRIFSHYNPRSLAAAVHFYLGEKLEGAHNASVDANAALRVFEAQLERYPELPHTVEQLHRTFSETSEEGYIDPEKKLMWRFGEAAINFGKKHAGKTLTRIRAEDPNFLHWMLKGDFSEQVKAIVQKTINGEKVTQNEPA